VGHQLGNGLCATSGSMVCASYPVNFIMSIQPITSANVPLLFHLTIRDLRIAAGDASGAVDFLAQTDLCAAPH
jgi:hypothetical protein